MKIIFEEITPPTKIKVVQYPGKGRGVMATSNISKGEIIEECPLLFLSEEEEKYCKTSPVLQYYVLELLSVKKSVLHLGYGLIYNHSETPNAEISYDGGESIKFIATQDILAGQEIVYDYWFEGEPELLKEEILLPLRGTEEQMKTHEQNIKELEQNIKELEDKLRESQSQFKYLRDKLHLEESNIQALEVQLRGLHRQKDCDHTWYKDYKVVPQQGMNSQQEYASELIQFEFIRKCKTCGYIEATRLYQPFWESYVDEDE